MDSPLLAHRGGTSGLGGTALNTDSGRATRVLPSGVPLTGQIAFMVRNLEGAVPHWLGLGIGPWSVWTFDAKRLPHRTYRGR